MKNLKQILIDYKANRQAIPAFNIDSFEVFQAVEAAIIDTSLPCIVQLSSGEDSFINAERLLLLVKRANLHGLPLYLNMDHGRNPDRLIHLVKLGFDMVHFDGSSFNYQKNIIDTTQLVKQLKSINPQVLIESEFNHINLVDDGVTSDSYTDPQQALDFVSQTGTDLLAISIGNLHGVSTSLPEIIDLDRLNSISRLIPNTFLTLHGGSGINPTQISSASGFGVVKININTDLRLQFKKTLLNSLNTINSEKIYDYFNPVIADLKTIIVSKLIQFANIS